MTASHASYPFCIWKTAFAVTVILLGITQVQGQHNAPVVQNLPAATVATAPAAYPEGAAINYTRSWQPTVPITNPTAVLTAGVAEVQQSSQYIDGLGRLIQSVTKGITPSGKDLVAPVVYDAFGREV